MYPNIFTIYADDTNRLADGETFPELLINCSDLFCKVKHWFTKNKLILNETKTKAILFSSNLLGNEKPYIINLDNASVELINTDAKFSITVYADDINLLADGETFPELLINCSPCGTPPTKTTYSTHVYATFKYICAQCEDVHNVQLAPQ